MAHQADPLGPAGDGAVVGDEDQREPALAPQGVEQGDDLVPGVLVQVPGRLVGEQHPGLLDQGAGDRHPLLLPAGQLAGQVLGAVAEPDAVQRGCYFVAPFGVADGRAG